MKKDSNILNVFPAKIYRKMIGFVNTITNVQVTHSAEEFSLSNKTLGSQE